MIRLGIMAAIVVLAVSPAAAESREALCQLLPVKGQFGGAAYVPGVDVNGNPVVPADVNALPVTAIDVIRFPVTIDLARQLNITLPEGTEMKAPVAMVDIHPDGRVVYNGEDFGPDLYAACGKEPFNYRAEPMAAPVVPVEPASEPAAVVTEPQPQAGPEPDNEIIWGEGY